MQEVLEVERSVVLDASGGGRITLGPDKGPPYWRITEVTVETDRPGQAPVPAFQLYKDGLRKGTTYDGSRNESDTRIELTRGQHLEAVWTGGQAGDTATITVSGYKGDRA